MPKKKANLTRRFVITGVFAMVIIVSLASLGGYYVQRTYGIDTATKELAEVINHRVSRILGDSNNADTSPSPTQLNSIAAGVKSLKDVKSVVIYQLDKKLVWAKDNAIKGGLTARESLAFSQLIRQSESSGVAIDVDFMQLDSWKNAPFGKMNVLPALIKIRNSEGRYLAIVKLRNDFSEAVNHALFFSFGLFLFAFLGALSMFLLLYWNFRRGVKTIELQEQKLNQQILRLSSLLNSNKNLQKSMKTASSRAVELNEQFLRRVGADLHDGPAQMIGFAVLRLNKVSKEEEAKQFSHEFHAVREALDQSLEEIRGISSGLVLPELESLSMEECLRKVVTLHGVKSVSEISQYYQGLDSPISLPVKICAYRFVQEGLNNAHHHGQAKKCRLSAHIKANELVISLKDNGIGFRKSTLNHSGGNIGLMGLRDRIESLGGQFNINSELGVGTALKLSLSLLDDD
jgi:signal transduction histidine kinase